MRIKGMDERTFADLLEAYLGPPEGLPEPDPGGQYDLLREYFDAGAPEFPYLYSLCGLGLRIAAPLLTGKTFGRMNKEERQDFLNRVFASRNPFLRSLSVLLGMPVFMSYYRRPEVCVPLGFDAASLRREAELRTVRRDRSLPPREVKNK